MVRISVGSPTHHTSGRLYGVFFEDINHGADGGLNANMVNNYSFDGVYLDHHTWRMAGAERWRTQADSLRFWDFINCSAASLGSEIRGIHGQRVTTDCPAPPIHAHSRYARITSDVPSETGPAYLENLGYNGGGDNGGEPAFSIVADHTYSVSLAVRPVHGRAELSVGVVDRYGLPLTSITRLSYIVDSDPLDDTEETGLRQDDGADAQDSGVSISPDSSDGAIVIGRDGWYRFNADVTGLNTDYGKLRITIDAGERTTFDLDLVSSWMRTIGARATRNGVTASCAAIWWRPFRRCIQRFCDSPAAASSKV